MFSLMALHVENVVQQWDMCYLFYTYEKHEFMNEAVVFGSGKEIGLNGFELSVTNTSESSTHDTGQL